MGRKKKEVGEKQKLGAILCKKEMELKPFMRLMPFSVDARTLNKLFTGFILNKKSLVLLETLMLIALFPFGSFAQSTNAPLNDEYYHLLDRYEIKQTSFSDHFYTGFKPFQRKSIAKYVNSKLASLEEFNPIDQFNLEFLANDNWEWNNNKENDEGRPVFNIFYKKKPNLYTVNTALFDLHIKPVVHLEAGIETGEAYPFFSTGGIELRGRVKKKVGFYTYLTKNYIRFPSNIQERIKGKGVVPGEGVWENHKSGGTDFFTTRGYISFDASRSINLQAGHDKFFIGNGNRSLILSDFGQSYPFMKIQTQVWKFSYTNLFAELSGNIPSKTNNVNNHNKKFFALHHLSLNVTDNLNFGFFEAIVSGDSLGGGFEVEYLNPVIFYRAAEHYTGSTTSNAFVGVDSKWNFLKHFQLYGQFVLDEFHLNYLREAKGWWANKWASQLGLKCIDIIGIYNLDLNMEWNRARPFIYSHKSGYTNYTHYGQPLAHPFGANFDEKLIVVRYQPKRKLNLMARYLQVEQGGNNQENNFGSNIFMDYRTRYREFGNKIGQGGEMKIKMIQFMTTYQLVHRLFVEISQTLRYSKSDFFNQQNAFISTVGLRWNVSRRESLF